MSITEHLFRSKRRLENWRDVWAAHNRILICILMCLLSHPLWAQDGQFYGVITDLAGSAVPHAKVVLQNTGTGLDRRDLHRCERKL